MHSFELIDFFGSSYNMTHITPMKPYHSKMETTGKVPVVTIVQFVMSMLKTLVLTSIT